MVVVLVIVGGAAAVAGILTFFLTIVKTGVKTYLCKKSFKALKRDVDELCVQLQAVQLREGDEHPAAAEARALQSSLQSAEALFEQYRRRKSRAGRFFNAKKDLDKLDHADGKICAAIDSLLAKLGARAPNEAIIMSRFTDNYYMRRDQRSWWSIFSKPKPSAANDPSRGNPPPPASPSPGAPGATVRRSRRMAKRVPAQLQGTFMGHQTNFPYLLKKGTAYKRMERAWKSSHF